MYHKIIKWCYDCNSTFTIYNKNEKHCCKCLMIYHKKENHCCKCLIYYSKQHRHCCTCKMIYFHESIHCCTCKMHYNCYEKHCCDCKMNYWFNNKHCCDCKMNCHIFFEIHCCIHKNQIIKTTNCSICEEEKQLHKEIYQDVINELEYCPGLGIKYFEAQYEFYKYANPSC